MKKTLLLFSLIFFSFCQVSYGKGEKIVNPNVEYTYETLLKDVTELWIRYPELLQVVSLGKTTYGKQIPALKLGNGKNKILLVGSHHGREWITTSLLMEMLETYAIAYKNKTTIKGFAPNILDDVSIWFVPMLNPDGVEIQQKGISHLPLAYQQLLLEMNDNDLSFSKWKANGVGIDLNRQYPAGWEKIKGDHPYGSYKFYKGEEPLEAVEVQALIKLINREDPLITIAYHSSGRVIYWHYKNNNNVVKRDKMIAKKISGLTGYELAKPPKQAVGGGLTDWFIQEYKRPGYTIEVSYDVEETNPPLSVFSEEWERNKAVGLMIAEEAKTMIK